MAMSKRRISQKCRMTADDDEQIAPEEEIRFDPNKKILKARRRNERQGNSPRVSLLRDRAEVFTIEQKRKGLNQSFIEAIDKAYEKNNLYDLSQLFPQYTKHIEGIQGNKPEIKEKPVLLNEPLDLSGILRADLPPRHGFMQNKEPVQSNPAAQFILNQHIKPIVDSKRPETEKPADSTISNSISSIFSNSTSQSSKSNSNSNSKSNSNSISGDGMKLFTDSTGSITDNKPSANSSTNNTYNMDSVEPCATASDTNSEDKKDDKNIKVDRPLNSAIDNITKKSTASDDKLADLIKLDKKHENAPEIKNKHKSEDKKASGSNESPVTEEDKQKDSHSTSRLSNKGTASKETEKDVSPLKKIDRSDIIFKGNGKIFVRKTTRFDSIGFYQIVVHFIRKERFISIFSPTEEIVSVPVNKSAVRSEAGSKELAFIDPSTTLLYKIKLATIKDSNSLRTACDKKDSKKK